VSFTKGPGTVKRWSLDSPLLRNLVSPEALLRDPVCSPSLPRTILIGAGRILRIALWCSVSAHVAIVFNSLCFKGTDR